MIEVDVVTKTHHLELNKPAGQASRNLASSDSLTDVISQTE